MDSPIFMGALVVLLLVVVFHKKISHYLTKFISSLSSNSETPRPLSCIPGQLALSKFTGKIRLPPFYDDASKACVSCSDSNTVNLGELHPRLASKMTDAEKKLPHVVWADDPHNKTGKTHCLCQPGYSGVDCTTKCPPGLNGPKCETKCSGDLHYYDPRLEMCLCKPGAETEPNGADQNCFFCSNDVKYEEDPVNYVHYDPVNKRCACKEKRNYGELCEYKCPDDKAPAGACCEKNSHVRISDYTGQSFCVCDDGFGGENCEKKCPEGRQGSECQFEAECPKPETYQGIPENYYFFGSEEREGNCA